MVSESPAFKPRKVEKPNIRNPFASSGWIEGPSGRPSYRLDAKSYYVPVGERTSQKESLIVKFHNTPQIDIVTF